MQLTDEPFLRVFKWILINMSNKYVHIHVTTWRSIVNAFELKLLSELLSYSILWFKKTCVIKEIILYIYQTFQTQVEPFYNKEDKVMIEISCILVFIYHQVIRIQNLFRQYTLNLCSLYLYLIKDRSYPKIKRNIL